jgi:coenzyme F420-reducing hydrogenase gamma subunit
MRNNFFGVLTEEYDDFDEIMPYSEISTNGGNWRLLKCSPVAELINIRFSKPRGVYELNEMKEQIENAIKSLEEDRVKMLPRLSQCDELIQKQRNLRSEIYNQALQKHLDACTGDGTGNYKCTQNRLSYYRQREFLYDSDLED